MNLPTILIADDDFELSQLVAMRLRTRGLNVLRSPDASHALLGVLRHQPDLLILDVDMPNGNGFAVREMLVNNQECQDIPTIIHTGLNSPGVRKRCQLLKAEYVHKSPGSTEKILEIVTRLLSLPQNTNLPITPSCDSPTDLQQDVESCDSCQNEVPKTLEFVELSWCSEDALPAAQMPAVEEPTSRHPLVLSIDDDPDISESLRLQLEPYGIGVLRAYSGEQGYALASKHQPDIIVTDLVLPEAEGAYIVRRIKSDPQLAKTPIFVLTGQSYPDIKQRIVHLGVDAFFTKPVSGKRLIIEIRNYLELSAAM